MSLKKYASETEQKIINTLIDNALGLGWKISVFDGELFACSRSRDKEEITSVMATTEDGDVLFFYSPYDDQIGTITLIYGNNEDVISDSSGNVEIIEPKE